MIPMTPLRRRRTTLAVAAALIAAPGVARAQTSVTAMFGDADIVVQAVMCVLLLASVVTWSVLLAKTIELSAARRGVARALAQAVPGVTLTALKSTWATGPAAAMVQAALSEMRLSAGLNHDTAQDRIAIRLRRIEAAWYRRLNRGTGILATIGSTAPFIGLFGTVWGIMNSFVGIAQSHVTSLAVVAPGIAEALLATATGLIAAIPAVVIYNGFARGIGGYRAVLADLAAALEVEASRELERPAMLLKAAE